MVEEGELRSLALTPTWSVATVLTILVAICLLVERSIHRLSYWLKKTRRNPLYEAVEKMKEEMMLLGFISLLLVASSRTISSICINSSYYSGTFSPCTREQVEASMSVEDDSGKKHVRRLLAFFLNHPLRRSLKENGHHSPCPKGSESFVSYEGLEQLHRFIFVMAITHVSYSCLTMLLAIVKVHTWRKWEEEAHRAHHYTLAEVTRALTFRRQSTFVKIHHSSSSWKKNEIVVWMTCFFRQFGNSVVRGDYLTLRNGFILNHNLLETYDFHKYMIRSMEEEFKRIVGVSGPLWGFVIAFMLFNINGSNLYFWIAIIPISLVLIVGAKLQHVIATLSIESAGLGGMEGRLQPRDDLFWFKKPELLLELIHFVLFQNAFELASFFWFWWQFGYDSCFIRNHLAVYCRLILGFAGQFLCSYSTLPLYALVTQMGSNYKAALIPERIRQTMHGWGKAARKRRKHRRGFDESTIRTETSTVCSLDEGDQELLDDESTSRPRFVQIELQPSGTKNRFSTATSAQVSTNGSGAPLLQSSASLPASPSIGDHRVNGVQRSNSMPTWERIDD
ncbi:MLO-like protein [Rhynchospora pubera]|uniref:MLO-like protein n=1 Tax=Rhynchospora pubera TaxID=906938 RepID=A0AAV8F0Q1_9POAL|nr:MLO-like protein [Rhynchospora pubera]